MVFFKGMPPVTYGLPTKSHIPNLSTPSPSGSFSIQIISPTQHLPGPCIIIKDTSAKQNSPGRRENGRTGGAGQRGPSLSRALLRRLELIFWVLPGFLALRPSAPYSLIDLEREEAEVLRVSMVTTETLGAEKSPKGV